MEKLDPDYIRVHDILKFCKEIEAIVSDGARDRKTEFALLYLVAVIGEASKQLSESFRETHPGIEWPKIISARNRMIHGYGKVDTNILWDIVRKDVPALGRYLQPVYDRMKRENR